MAILQNASGSEAELPFSIYDNDNVPITGHVFVAGEVRVRVPGGTFVDADTANILECGLGQYVLQLTEMQTGTEGAVVVHFESSGLRTWVNYEMISSDGDEVLEIPFAIYDGDGLGVEGFSFSTGDVKIRLPNEMAFVNADVANIDELGAGQYVLVLDVAQRAEPGAIFVYFSDGANQPYYGYELNVIDTIPDEDDDETPTPIPVPNPEVQVSYVAHAQAMLDRLPEYAKQDVI